LLLKHVTHCEVQINITDLKCVGRISFNKQDTLHKIHLEITNKMWPCIRIY